MSQEYLTRNELLAIEKQKASTIWYNPVDGHLYVDSTSKVQPHEKSDWARMDKAFNVKGFQEAKTAYLQGKVSTDKLKALDFFVGDYAKWAGEAFQSAGVITNSNFSAIDSLTVFNKVLGQEQAEHVLDQFPTVVTSDTLELSVDVYSKFEIDTDVPEGLKGEAKRGSFTTVDFDLTKDVAHVAITDEAQMKARQDLKGIHVRNASIRFAKAKATKIATALATATDVSAGPWDALTNEHSTRDPYDDIGSAEDTIRANDGIPSVMACDNEAYRHLLGNTYYKGAFNPQGNSPQAPSSVVSVNGLPGRTLYIDPAMTANTFVIADKEAVFLVNGPTRMGTYRDEQNGYDGTVMRAWYQVKLTQSGRIRELTSL